MIFGRVTYDMPPLDAVQVRTVVNLLQIRCNVADAPVGRGNVLQRCFFRAEAGAET
jgi:hypothetical protein